MATILVPDKLVKAVDSAIEQIENGEAQNPVVIESGVSRAVAEAVADRYERKGFIFEADEDHAGGGSGTLLIFFDPSGPHERAAGVVASQLLLWLWPWANVDAAVGEGVLVASHSERVGLGAGFREPGESLFLPGAAAPNAVVEVAYSQSRANLLLVMVRWTAPAGPARVVFGVDVQYPPPPNGPPRIEVLMQLAGQTRPSAIVSCGGGSGCISPAMHKYTIFVPLHELLFGVPWPTRLAISLQLAVTVPVYSVLRGVMYAAADVLYGRRSLRQVVWAGMQSLVGPWWGVVPLDTFAVRRMVLSGLRRRE